MQKVLARLNEKGLTRLAETQTENIASYTASIEKAQATIKSMSYDAKYINRMQARSDFCGYMRAGAAVVTVVMVAITATLLYLDYMQIKAHYKVNFTSQPRYIVEEKDLTSYNSKGEKIVLKNQSAYYKLVETNRTAEDEFYNVLGTGSDLNGDVGQQWLALYAVKNDAMDPILASSIKVVVGDENLPAGYTKGIHMFGSETAFNLNSELYDWNNSAKSVMVYFKIDEGVKAAGSTFTGGSVALAGFGGLADGMFIISLVAAVAGKKKKKTQRDIKAQIS